MVTDGVMSHRTMYGSNKHSAHTHRKGEQARRHAALSKCSGGNVGDVKYAEMPGGKVGITNRVVLWLGDVFQCFKLSKFSGISFLDLSLFFWAVVRSICSNCFNLVAQMPIWEGDEHKLFLKKRE